MTPWGSEIHGHPAELPGTFSRPNRKPTCQKSEQVSGALGGVELKQEGEKNVSFYYIITAPLNKLSENLDESFLLLRF